MYEALQAAADLSTSKIKKGTEVYFFSVWSQETFAYTIRQYTVASWGKKQGHLIHAESGRTAKIRIYTDHVNVFQGGYADFLWRVADLADPEAMALTLSKRWIDWHIANRKIALERAEGQTAKEFERKVLQKYEAMRPGFRWYTYY